VGGAGVKSCLYTGTIQHRRHVPVSNAFKYRLFMMYLDLAELPQVFEPYLFWSAKRAAPARFKREDYLRLDGQVDGEDSLSLDESVRRLVTRETGKRPGGPIRLLTHLRYFGYSFNPVSFYYCFDERDEQIETIVAEITNTPWKERHAYVLPTASSVRNTRHAWQFKFDKKFHVSPFNPMDMRYDWRFSAPEDGLHVHMENWRDDASVFDATLNLKREPITSASLVRALIGFPLITAQVMTLIHWQALRLLIKRSPFYTHPDKLTTVRGNTQ
jgi:DUF1365 family protein